MYPIILLWRSKTLIGSAYTQAARTVCSGCVLGVSSPWGIGKGKNRRFKSCLKEGTAVTGVPGLCIPITLHCNLQVNNLKTTVHRDTKFQTVNLDA